MAASAQFLLLVVLSLTSSLSRASDPPPLQDFCVANPSSTVFLNGQACKDPKLATSDDFLFSGLDVPGNTSNPFSASITVARIPGLNTLGMTLVLSSYSIDFAPNGLFPPHLHPRATEVLTVLKGRLYVGFITTGNRLFSKVLKKGDVFVLPQGLVHFQSNNNTKSASAIVALSSQNPGIINLPTALFGSNPGIPNDVLGKAFLLDEKTIGRLKGVFGAGPSS